MDFKVSVDIKFQLPRQTVSYKTVLGIYRDREQLGFNI